MTANWLNTENRLGVTSLQNVDSTLVDNSTSNARYPIGTTVRGTDSTFGGGTFIYLPGGTSVTVGSLVYYETGASPLVALSPVTANLGQPVAVSLASNPSASNYSWYQIEGTATVLKITSVAFTGPNLPVYQDLSAGQVSATTGTGKQILNATSAATAATAATTMTIQIARPFMQGQII